MADGRPDIRDDRTEEQKCDDLIEQLRGTVYRFSVGTRAQLPDLPDRRYYLRGIALWAEIKAPRGTAEGGRDKISQGQLDFLRREYDAGQIVFAGGRDELGQVLMQHQSSEWRRLGWAQVAVVAARGLRKERRT